MSQTKQLAELLDKHLGVSARGIALGLVRAAKTIGRANEVDCSVSDPSARKYWHRRSEQAERRIDALVGELAKYGDVTVKTQGDPRGYAVRLYIGADRRMAPSNNWGGGWGIG